MAAEYVLFNLAVIAGPLALSFDRQVRYYRRWGMALLSAALVAPGYLFWDAAVTGKHWNFNPDYTLDLKLGGLPIGEWLFFFTVPFSCLFIWEILKVKNIAPSTKIRSIPNILLLIPIPPAIALFVEGKEYTGLVLLALVAGIALDKLFATQLLGKKRLLVFLGIYWAILLLCNGYLTARPVVLYNPAVQLDWRVLTIPIEDFIYGTGHMLFVMVVYEKLTARYQCDEKQI
ncbi:lycopene cyclase domain-containing protein [candidate division KSB1 bacterium]|nr:lycopene cyclase domain-containing protein [candidate division KSB1 bacterium]